MNAEQFLYSYVITWRCSAGVLCALLESRIADQAGEDLFVRFVQYVNISDIVCVFLFNFSFL